MSEEKLLRKLARAEERIKTLEAMTEDRTRELYRAFVEIQEAMISLEKILNAVPNGVLVFNEGGTIEAVNETAAKILSYSKNELLGRSVDQLFGTQDLPIFTEIQSRIATGIPLINDDRNVVTAAGEFVPVMFSGALIGTVTEGGETREKAVCVMVDIRDRRELGVELRQSHKLQGVGQLASGVAHEINTPIQFVSDSVHFLLEASADITTLIEKYRLLGGVARNIEACRAQAEDAINYEEEIDLSYVLENMPKALDRSLDGLQRVATIVRSMKAFAHPDTTEMSAVDLNDGIQGVLTIARNEYKYVADVSTELGDIPRVTCYAGDVNQVILNIVVNAAHAISEKVDGTSERGQINIRTSQVSGGVEISISDTGKGIPMAVRERIFDPFFTTKAVGKGTGQGLALARGVIVERHHGSITFDTEIGKGTTFFIRLPIAPSNAVIAS